MSSEETEGSDASQSVTSNHGFPAELQQELSRDESSKYVQAIENAWASGETTGISLTTMFRTNCLGSWQLGSLVTNSRSDKEARAHAFEALEVAGTNSTTQGDAMVKAMLDKLAVGSVRKLDLPESIQCAQAVYRDESQKLHEALAKFSEHTPEPVVVVETPTLLVTGKQEWMTTQTSFSMPVTSPSEGRLDESDLEENRFMPIHFLCLQEFLARPSWPDWGTRHYSLLPDTSDGGSVVSMCDMRKDAPSFVKGWLTDVRVINSDHRTLSLRPPSDDEHDTQSTEASQDSTAPRDPQSASSRSKRSRSRSVDRPDKKVKSS